MKRIIAFSDGLWTSKSIPGNSNLGLLRRALDAGTDNGVRQIVLTDPFQHLGGAAACGRRLSLLKDSVCHLYGEIAANYEPGDTLWLFGFSRGGFVVRSCVGLMRNLGLLAREHLDRLPEAWHIYRTTWGPDANNARHFRDVWCRPAAVKFLGVFDTLGPLGVPVSANPDMTTDQIGFHDCALSNIVDFACHALAIDEWRRHFAACLWRTGAERNRTEQCWFTGKHKDIGGIQGDPALANITLRWMAARASALGLGVNSDFLERAMATRCEEQREDYNSGRVGKTGTHIRPIGVTNGDETLHPSAEQRFLRNRDYRPSNLKAYMGKDDQIQLPL